MVPGMHWLLYTLVLNREGISDFCVGLVSLVNVTIVNIGQQPWHDDGLKGVSSVCPSPGHVCPARGPQPASLELGAQQEAHLGGDVRNEVHEMLTGWHRQVGMRTQSYACPLRNKSHHSQ